jgi:hypothetical protein
VERKVGKDGCLLSSVKRLDVSGWVCLGIAQLGSFGERIRSRMKLVVPFTIPMMRFTLSPASDSRSGRMIGIAPATAASK